MATSSEFFVQTQYLPDLKKKKKKIFLKAELSEENKPIAHNTGKGVNSLKSTPQVHQNRQLPLHGLLRLRHGIPVHGKTAPYEKLAGGATHTQQDSLDIEVLK